MMERPLGGTFFNFYEDHFLSSLSFLSSSSSVHLPSSHNTFFTQKWTAPNCTLLKILNPPNQISNCSIWAKQDSVVDGLFHIKIAECRLGLLMVCLKGSPFKVQVIPQKDGSWMVVPERPSPKGHPDSLLDCGREKKKNPPLL